MPRAVPNVGSGNVSPRDASRITVVPTTATAAPTATQNHVCWVSDRFASAGAGAGRDRSGTLAFVRGEGGVAAAGSGAAGAGVSTGGGSVCASGGAGAAAGGGVGLAGCGRGWSSTTFFSAET